MNPTHLLPVVLIGLFTVPHTTDRVEAADKPNIVFIMADDLGTGHLGFNGQDKTKTPNIDRLRQGGLYFNQVYAGCAVCAPCRSVLMTGYHMGHTSVRGNSGGIPLLDDDVTIALSEMARSRMRPPLEAGVRDCRSEMQYALGPGTGAAIKAAIGTLREK